MNRKSGGPYASGVTRVALCVGGDNQVTWDRTAIVIPESIGCHRIA